MNEQVVANMAKYAGMLAKGGFTECGYLAVKVDGGMYLTKSYSVCEDIAAEDIIFVTAKSISELEGNFRAAAVILFCAMRSASSVGAAAIVDSKGIVEFSKLKKTLPPVLDDMAQIDGVSVRCAKNTTAAEIILAIAGLRNACFLPDAGALVTGRTLDEVYTASLVLDKAATCYVLASKKGGVRPHSRLNAFLEHVVYKLKYSKKNVKSQEAAEKGKEVEKEEKPSAIETDEQKALAQSVKDAGVKLLEENLVQGTWGNIAVRLDDKTMLATPSGIDYVMLRPDQMAIVDMETLEWKGSNKATSEKGIHAVLMLADSEVNATVHTHPFYGCILAAMCKPLAVPEKYRDILGNEIPCAKSALPGRNTLVNNVKEAIGDAKACFLGNHGVIVKGKDLEDTFKICRALEDACKDYLLSE